MTFKLLFQYWSRFWCLSRWCLLHDTLSQH